MHANSGRPQCVLNETLRLYPSVPKNMKRCLRDDVLPDGTFVPSGHSVAFFPWTMGRLTALWGADAEEFRPERWEEFEAAGERPSPFKFIAFQVRRAILPPLLLLMLRL